MGSYSSERRFLDSDWLALHAQLLMMLPKRDDHYPSDEISQSSNEENQVFLAFLICGFTSEKWFLAKGGVLRTSSDRSVSTLPDGDRLDPKVYSSLGAGFSKPISRFQNSRLAFKSAFINNKRRNVFTFL